MNAMNRAALHMHASAPRKLRRKVAQHAHCLNIRQSFGGAETRADPDGQGHSRRASIVACSACQRPATGIVTRVRAARFAARQGCIGRVPSGLHPMQRETSTIAGAPRASAPPPSLAEMRKARKGLAVTCAQVLPKIPASTTN